MTGDSPHVPTGQPLTLLLRRLIKSMGPQRRRQYLLLVGLMILAAFAELVSIGSVLPFLTALLQPELVYKNAHARSLILFLGIDSSDRLVVALTIAFVAATVAACLIRMGLLWASTRLSFAFGSDLSNRLYRSTLAQPYALHVARNSSEIVNVIWGKVSEVIFYILLPMVVLVTSAVVAAVICIALVVAVPATALVALVGLVLVYALIIKFSRQRLRINSVRVAGGSTKVVKTLQEGLGGIRDILIDGTHAHFESTYRLANRDLRQAQGENQIISQGPRYLLEALGMLLIATLAYLLTTRSGGAAASIPLLAAIALSLQRLLPAAQSMFNAWSTIHGAQASLQDVLDMLASQRERPAESDAELAPMPFTREIQLRRVSFRHRTDVPRLFDALDLVIRKGSRTGFVGATGSGKSTLLDIVMGLIDPETGDVAIDGVPLDDSNRRAWQRHIAHVPQSVFLADSTLEENIAFGIDPADIDAAKVRAAAQRAQLHELVESWPQRYRTRVGERGVQLSGGQRQRIGIARALYKQADVIVFDEATSALDNETEEAVMQAIEGLHGDITVLIIAHRLNTLRNCDSIIEVGLGAASRRAAVDLSTDLVKP